jgi:stage V sporulation protein SpoVS
MTTTYIEEKGNYMSEEKEVQKSSSEEIVLRVKNESNVHKMAGAIAHNVNERKVVKVAAIGAQAISQACKSSTGYDLLVAVGFFKTEITDKASQQPVERTGLEFRIILR